MRGLFQCSAGWALRTVLPFEAVQVRIQMCPERSWKILLASAPENFILYISFINLRDGREGSMCLNLAYRGDPTQSRLHLSFRTVLSACSESSDADLLRLSCFLRILGKLVGFDDAPSAAFLAPSSASSLPGMPECPGVHHRINYILQCAS